LENCIAYKTTTNAMKVSLQDIFLDSKKENKMKYYIKSIKLKPNLWSKKIPNL
jgi:hypothetical protein